MSTETQPALFEVTTPPVAPSKRATAGAGRPRWARYRVKEPVKCDDCMAVLADAGGIGPASRQAKWRRKQGAADLLLCFAHAALRRTQDGFDGLPESAP